MSNLTTILWKNYILKKRKLKTTIVEVLLPSLIIILLIIIRIEVDPVEVKPTNIPGTNDGDFLDVYKLAIVPNNNFTQGLRKYMLEYSLLNDSELMFFNSENDLIDYIQNVNYGQGNVSEIDLAIVMNDMKERNQYSYSIRGNFSSIPMRG